MTSLTDTLALFAVTCSGAAIPEDAGQVARLSLLDWIAVGRAGTSEPVARILRQQAEDEGGAPQASIFGSATRAPMRMAALVNGTTSHALDYDDTHFDHIGHPSVAVLPAALAMAESRGASGRALRDAALIGMELSIRVGVWLGRAHYQAGFHQTATAGSFGATAAAGRLAGLTAPQMAAALGLVSTRASGLKSQFGTMGKPYNAGLAAANGIEAVALVARGFQPNAQALDAAQGFGPTHHGAGNLDAVETLGSDWRFTAVSHKFHACCHGLHATLEALQSLPAIDPGTVTQIDIRTHPRWMSVCNQTAPETGLGAKFSYTTVAAMRLLGHDTARLDSYSDGLCADPALRALRDRVTVAADPALSETAAQVTVALTDGGVVRAGHDLDAPLSLEARTSKVRAKAAALLGPGRADEIWRDITAESSAQDLARHLAP